jgi:hypothetical protein
MAADMRARLADLYDRIGSRWPAVVAVGIAVGYYVGVQVGFCRIANCG